ncbi:hypothetical protein RRG08_053585 [Elysia crispata]|uniref:Uncharacterized protein n=1 Tax=Elysia crispata TaxID=231223 RepID=A0AAE0Y164_9GAST|nr:hypothetical protein RRG08_053585 [Elysia crispata]
MEVKVVVRVIVAVEVVAVEIVVEIGLVVEVEFEVVGLIIMALVVRNDNGGVGGNDGSQSNGGGAVYHEPLDGLGGRHLVYRYCMDIELGQLDSHCPCPIWTDVESLDWLKTPGAGSDRRLLPMSNMDTCRES